jgi:hypothetical protein
MMLAFTYFFLPSISAYSKAWMFSTVRTIMSCSTARRVCVPISRHLDDMITLQGIAGGVPSALVWPFIALLNKGALLSIQSIWVRKGTMWFLLLGSAILKAVMGCLCFTAVTIQINHSVVQTHLGAVNGLGQSMASLARAVGPAVGGAMWSMSTQVKFSLEHAIHGIFVALNVLLSYRVCVCWYAYVD